MYGEPNWLASYLAKKITRLAFSVYRSNIFPSPRCSQSPLPETSLSLTPVANPRPLRGKKSFSSSQRPPSRGLNCYAGQNCNLPNRAEITPKTVPGPPLNSAKRAIPPLPGRDADAKCDHSGERTQGYG